MKSNMSASELLAEADNVYLCISLSLSLLVVPIALVTFVVMSFRSYNQKRLIEMTPLLLSQLNTAFIWTCNALYRAGALILFINGHSFLRGYLHSFRNESIECLLAMAIRLEPLNIFLYIWRFLATLEREEENLTMKKVFRWFARLSIVVVPLANYGLFAALVVEQAKEESYFYAGPF